ncbi:MAG: M20/M25/M40 family metallo-hydrolase [Planctomycetota bacterium]
MLQDAEILALHREIVAYPSISGQEDGLCTLLCDWLSGRGWNVHRTGDSLWVVNGTGPLLMLDTHIDTVPPSPKWTREPHTVTVEDGRVYGLGSNDAKASVVAMIAALENVGREDLGLTLCLGLAAEEETKSRGTEMILEAMKVEGYEVAAAVIGEPTGLDIATSQKGLLMIDIAAEGDACHAANATALGARNAAFRLARDIVALEELDRGEDHPRLGPATLQATVLQAGTARNMIPAEATALLDIRTTPTRSHAEWIKKIRGVVDGEVHVRSQRLEPRETAEDHPIVQAARRARPEAKLYGSAGMSDLVLFQGIPAIKVGPGRTERSHTPDEFVLEEEILAGARFYEAVVRQFAASLTRS